MEPSPPWQVSHGIMAQSFPPAILLLNFWGVNLISSISLMGLKQNWSILV